MCTCAIASPIPKQPQLQSLSIFLFISTRLSLSWSTEVICWPLNSAILSPIPNSLVSVCVSYSFFLFSFLSIFLYNIPSVPVFQLDSDRSEGSITVFVTRRRTKELRDRENELPSSRKKKLLQTRAAGSKPLFAPARLKGDNHPD